MKIYLINPEHVVSVNKAICNQQSQQHLCLDIGKVESALHSSFYPGSYPFAHGGVGKLSGSLCYYITQSHAFVDGNKRTAATVANIFLQLNGYVLEYPQSDSYEMTLLAENVIECAKGNVTRDEMADWFDLHKVRL